MSAAARNAHPYAGESLPSFLVRTAHRSAAWEDELAARVGGYHATASALSAQRLPGELAAEGFGDRESLSSCQLSHLGAGLYRVGSLTLAADHISGLKRRVAPGLLASDIACGRVPYHRLAWCIDLVDTDIVTNEKLIDSCPRCSSALSWRDVAEPGICETCGQKLWLQTPEYPTEGEFEYASLAGKLLHPDDVVRENERCELPKGLHDAHEAEIFDFVDAVATFESLVSAQPRPYPVTKDLRLKALHLVRGGHRGLVHLVQKHFDKLEGEHPRWGTILASSICKAAAERCRWPKSREYFLAIFREAVLDGRILC